MTSFQYDAFDRPTNVIQPDGSVFTTSYFSNQVTVVDEASKKRRTHSDAFGRIQSVWEPDAAGNFIYETSYQYDALDNLIRVDQKGNDANSANWRTRTYLYDSLSRLLKASNPESGTICYGIWSGGLCLNGYDADGNLLKKTDARSITITHTYDSLHRLTGKTYSNGEPALSICYDLQSCTTLAMTNGVGRRLNMTDASGSSAWSYDALGRVITARQTILGATKTVSYGYNLAGSPTSITYPSGRRIDYGYDAAGRQLSAIDSTNAVNYVLNASYAPQGTLKQALFGSDHGSVGTTLTQTFNNRLQPSTIRAVQAARTALDLAYDFNLGTGDNGNVARITNNRDTARSQAFDYDSLNRVKTASTPNSALWGNSFVYDPWGNLLQKVVTQGTAETLNLTVNGSNRITGYCYDAAGNLLNQGACGTPTYNYGAEGQMTSTAGLTFTYDGDGQRVSKSGYRHYWFGAGDSPLAETYIGGIDKREYIFFAGRRIAHVDLAISGNNCQPECARYYYLADHLGSTAALVSTLWNNTQHEADFYPFGGERVITSSSIDPKYRFTGKERDPESGLDNFGARYFGSSLGRFLTADEPFADQFEDDPQSWNLYTYVSNNPLRFTDPDGRGKNVCSVGSDGKEACMWVGEFDGQCEMQNGRSVCWNKAKSEWGEPPTQAQQIWKNVQWGVSYTLEQVYGSQLGAFLDASSRNDLQGAIALGSLLIPGRVKRVNLPAAKKINVNLDHILSGHKVGGARVSAAKSLFPAAWTDAQVERAIREAYKNSKRLATQGERVRVRGEAYGVVIEMRVNTATRTIETAYPIW